MTEADEIAARMHAQRKDSGLSVLLPIETFDDALRVVRARAPDLGQVQAANVAEALLREVRAER